MRKTRLHDRLLRRVLSSSAVLLSGNIVAAVLAVGTYALSARGLGPEQFGYFVVITTYVAIVDQLVNFNTWQALIKFGSTELSAGNRGKLKTLLSIGFFLDLVTAVLGALIAAVGAWVIAGWMQWDSQVVAGAALFSLTIVFRLTGMPTAALRLFDKFNMLAVHVVAAAALKLIGVSVVTALGGDLWYYLGAWALAEFGGFLLLVYLGFQVSRKQNVQPALWPPPTFAPGEFKEFWAVTWTVNLSDSIRLATREVDVLLVGSILGPVSVANYRIAKQVAEIPMKLANPLQQVIYPYLATLWNDGEKESFHRYARLLALGAGLFGLVSLVLGVFLGESVVTILFGDEYREAAVALHWLLLAYCFFYFGIHLRPKALILGAHLGIFRIYVVSTIIFYLVYFPLISSFGISGAAFAHVLFFAAWYLQMMLVIRAFTLACN